MTRKRPTPRLPADAGLTILELMIVLVILSLIGTVVAVQVVGQMDRAKVDVARLQMRQLQNALTLFRLDTHRYPAAAEGLAVLIEPPQDPVGWRGPYIKNNDLLADPWGHAISYALDDAGAYVLTSRGGDGKDGGDGTEADITLGEAQ